MRLIPQPLDIILIAADTLGCFLVLLRAMDKAKDMLNRAMKMQKEEFGEL